jgi:hypothetical protein
MKRDFFKAIENRMDKMFANFENDFFSGYGRKKNFKSLDMQGE